MLDRQRLFLVLVISTVLLALSGWLIYTAVIRSQNMFMAGSPPLDLKNAIPEQTVDLAKMRPPAVRLTDFARYGGATSSASLILFGNYSCASCKNLEKSINEIAPKYRGKVRFIWRDLPQHGTKNDLNAATFATCAGVQGKFWEAHDLLIQSPVQDELTLSDVASRLKLDLKLLSSCRLDPTAQSTLLQDAQAVGADGVTSTPILFIGTQASAGYLSPAELDKRIKQFLQS